MRWRGEEVDINTHLWTIEDAGLVHVVPGVEVEGGPLVVRQLVLLREIAPGEER